MKTFTKLADFAKAGVSLVTLEGDAVRTTAEAVRAAVAHKSPTKALEHFLAAANVETASKDKARVRTGRNVVKRIRSALDAEFKARAADAKPGEFLTRYVVESRKGQAVVTAERVEVVEPPADDTGEAHGDGQPPSPKEAREVEQESERNRALLEENRILRDKLAKANKEIAALKAQLAKSSKAA